MVFAFHSFHHYHYCRHYSFHNDYCDYNMKNWSLNVKQALNFKFIMQSVAVSSISYIHSLTLTLSPFIYFHIPPPFLFILLIHGLKYTHIVERLEPIDCLSLILIIISHRSIYIRLKEREKVFVIRCFFTCS